MADANQQLFDMWRKQVEEGSQAWLRMLGTPQAAPMDPQAFWRPFMDQGIAAWSKVMTQGQASPDLMAQWKQFLDQWIAAWSRVLEQAMGTEAFAKTLGAQMQGFLNTANPGAVLLSGVLMLEHMGWDEAAQLVNRGLEATFAESEEVAGRGPGGKLYVTYDIARQFPGYGAEAGATSATFGDRIIHHLNRL